jgi:DNA-binding PadR family transcriptional regulator
MLSKIALFILSFILSFITERPLNPYEIKKVFERMQIDKWFPIGSSSIYATIKTLLKKGYISGTTVKEGNMPEKTIYAITSQGKDALQQTLIAYLSEREQILSEFDLAMILICHLEKETALKGLEQHRGRVEQEIAVRKQVYTRTKDNGTIPYPGLIEIQHSMYKREAELRTINDLIEEVKKDAEWNRFPVVDLLGEEGV